METFATLAKLKYGHKNLLRKKKAMHIMNINIFINLLDKERNPNKVALAYTEEFITQALRFDLILVKEEQILNRALMPPLEDSNVY